MTNKKINSKALSESPGPSSKSIVALVDKRIGNDNQALALANSLNTKYDVINIEYNKFAKLPNSLLSLWPVHVKKSVIKNFLTRPIPEIIISSGRRPAALALHLKRLSGGKSKIIQIMRPNACLEQFEMIILPQHDSFNKVLPNIVRIIGALNDVKNRIPDARHDLEVLYPEIKSFIAVIIGGSSKGYSFTKQNGKSLLETISRISENHSLPLFVTFSRRTPDIVKQLFKKKLTWPNVIYDPIDKNEKNPYPSILGAAQYIIVTTDSVSMCSEAAATGKPIYAYCPANFKLKKHRFFIQQLIDLGIVRRLEDSTSHLEKYDYEPLNEVDKVAALIKEKILNTTTKTN